ncbi:MAG: PEP-CTERM sorting domain-containing protein [Planctomycetia bacterium]|jgi:hypothetical protein
MERQVFSFSKREKISTNRTCRWICTFCVVAILIYLVPAVHAESVVTPEGDGATPSGFFSTTPLVEGFDSTPTTDLDLVVGQVWTGDAGDYAAGSAPYPLWGWDDTGIVIDFLTQQPVSEVGIVFTDLGIGPGLVRFEAWSGLGTTGSLLGYVEAVRDHDGTYEFNLGDDSFFGLKNIGPIRSIKMYAPNGTHNGGIEADKVQYVVSNVPEPGMLSLLLATGLAVGSMAVVRRRSA